MSDEERILSVKMLTATACLPYNIDNKIKRILCRQMQCRIVQILTYRRYIWLLNLFSAFSWIYTWYSAYLLNLSSIPNLRLLLRTDPNFYSTENKLALEQGKINNSYSTEYSIPYVPYLLISTDKNEKKRNPLLNVCFCRRTAGFIFFGVGWVGDKRHIHHSSLFTWRKCFNKRRHRQTIPKTKSEEKKPTRK